MQIKYHMRSYKSVNKEIQIGRLAVYYTRLLRMFTRQSSVLKTLFLSILFSVSTQAKSYPVLDAVAGLPNPELVTVYPDDSDKNLYYFVPTSVSLVRSGDDVRLGVQYWGLTGSDPAGVGAALTFSVEPAYDKAAVDAVAESLKSVNSNARFAFPTLTKSKMDVVLNSNFFPKNQDTTEPLSTTGGTVDATQAFSICLLYTSPSPRDQRGSRMPSSA